MLKSQKPSSTRHVTKRGTITYDIDNPDFASGNWGLEHFIITRHGNGDRVLRAYCELNDEPALIRDVLICVDADFHPRDATVRLTEGDEFKGTGWYHFTDKQIDFQGFNAAQGRISKTMEIDRSIRGFVNHALSGDAWLVARFDRAKGPRQQTFYNNPLSSADHRGATGPRLETSDNTTIEYKGEDHVTVPAGTFSCHHFIFLIPSGNHPPYHLWVTADGDFVFVKATVDAPYNWTFELTEFSES